MLCNRSPRFVVLLWLLLSASSLVQLAAQQTAPPSFPGHRAAALAAGDPARGKAVFESKEAACSKCHETTGDERRAGPKLSVIGDKLSREQLIDAILEPSAVIHPDYATLVVTTSDGRNLTGVLSRRTATEVQLLDAESKDVAIAIEDIEAEQKVPTSLMPAEIAKTLSETQFADLVAYLATLKQDLSSEHPGMPAEIPMIDRPIHVRPLHRDELRFDHPVWVIAEPGRPGQWLVIEQQTRKIWRLFDEASGGQKELFADLSNEAITGQYEGIMCLDFHPRYLENRKYYVNYHVREGGKFSPVIAERLATDDLQRDTGLPSRRLMRIVQDTDLHWGGMLAFGPDGYLYIGAGDGGPQEDPDGNSQNLALLRGSILRIDVDGRTGDLPYAIPKDNPYRGQAGKVREEIWASGFRMPWRFSWDSATGDMWVGEIGQYLFEEVTMPRLGENHGWNVYEAFTEFSDRYRREGVEYTPPVFSYRRKYGVSVTGGYVYRGTRSPSYYGAYIFGDFESQRIWALTQQDRKLIKVRQIGQSPEKIASFGLDAEGEILMVGYEGTIYRLLLDESVFE